MAADLRAQEETHEMIDQDPPQDATSPRCRKCQEPIEPGSEDDALDSYGSFFRLRCAAVECGHIDWYKDVPFPPAVTPDSSGKGAPGEVWIHDAVLGTSCKTDGNVSAG